MHEKLAIVLTLASLLASASTRAQNAYITDLVFNTVSVIDTATNTVIATMPVGVHPAAFGVFIQPRFAGVPGSDNCLGTSFAALPQKFAGLNAAAAALGFSTVQ